MRAPTAQLEEDGAPGDITAELRNLDFAFLEEWADAASSLWRSAAEAAYRGDALTFAVHLRQARLIAFTVTQTLEKVPCTGGDRP